jgi:hypothetical protein
MPKRNQGKEDKRNPPSGRAKQAKRRKTTAKGPTSTRTARPSRAFSPTLSETERRARQAIVLMDLDVIQNYFKDNELSPPNTTFKSDWADVYASACAVRRLSGLDPLPSLPQAKASKAPGPKKKKGVKRKTPPRPKKGDKKDTKATSPHPGLPPQEPGSESTDVTLQGLSKLSPAHREKNYRSPPPTARQRATGGFRRQGTRPGLQPRVKEEEEPLLGHEHSTRE